MNWIEKHQKGKVIQPKGDPYSYTDLGNGTYGYKKENDTRFSIATGDAAKAIKNKIFSNQNITIPLRAGLAPEYNWLNLTNPQTKGDEIVKSIENLAKKDYISPKGDDYEYTLQGDKYKYRPKGTTNWLNPKSLTAKKIL